MLEGPPDSLRHILYLLSNRISLGDARGVNGIFDREQVSVLRQALAEGAELNALDKCGLTALMWAARVGRLSSARYIIARGANVSLKHDSSGFTALHFAAYYCRYVPIFRADAQRHRRRGHIRGDSAHNFN